MHIKNIEAVHFRNFSHLELNFDIKKPINFIVAPNGMGKSNLLEIIYYLSHIRSFRNIRDDEISQKGNDGFFIKGKFIRNNISESIEINYSKKKEISLNGKKLNKFSDILGRLVSIIFTNEDIFLVNGPPSIRRKYFDSFLSIIDREYLDALNKYNKLLKQKNVLLKQNFDFRLLDIYDKQLSETIFIIQTKRNKELEKINSIYQEKFNLIGLFNHKTKIVYQPSINVREISVENIYNYIKKNEKKYIEFGFFIDGSHRDNFLFLINGIPFHKYASLGQMRLCALSVKIAQYEIYSKFFQFQPIVLLDDVILELDSERKKRFLEEISKVDQMFITVTNEKYMEYFDLNLINKIGIDHGIVR